MCCRTHPVTDVGLAWFAQSIQCGQSRPAPELFYIFFCFCGSKQMKIWSTGVWHVIQIDYLWRIVNGKQQYSLFDIFEADFLMATAAIRSARYISFSPCAIGLKSNSLYSSYVHSFIASKYKHSVWVGWGYNRDGHGSGPVSYTHLTLPTNREV